VFHTDTWIGLTLGIILGSLIGYALNRPKHST
jgi:cytochrome c biogenesis factor